jgi:hypothetical protein
MKRRSKRLITLLALCGFLSLSSLPGMAASEAAARQQTAVVLSSSGENNDVPWYYICIFLLAGPIFYYSTKARYTGETKRHEHEQTTKSAIGQLEKKEIFLRSVTNDSSSDIGFGKKYMNSNEIKPKNAMFVSEFKPKKK